MLRRGKAAPGPRARRSSHAAAEAHWTKLRGKLPPPIPDDWELAVSERLLLQVRRLVEIALVTGAEWVIASATPRFARDESRVEFDGHVTTVATLPVFKAAFPVLDQVCARGRRS